MWSVKLQWIMTDKWRVYRLVSSTHNKRGVIKSQQFFEKCSLKAISVSIQKQSHPDVAAKMHASPECYWTHGHHSSFHNDIFLVLGPTNIFRVTLCTNEWILSQNDFSMFFCFFYLKPYSVSRTCQREHKEHFSTLKNSSVHISHGFF